jgi:enoyl-CoA hydratase / 3-hydroxyacyl-CoA dehydrogenase
MLATRDARLQLPEILLGIAPGLGAMVVPYCRWPQAAPEFHNMMRRAERPPAPHALGTIDALADDFPQLIEAAIARAHVLKSYVRPRYDGTVVIAPLAPIEPTGASGQRLSAEVIGIIDAAIRDATASPTPSAALEVSYRALGVSDDEPLSVHLII